MITDTKPHRNADGHRPNVLPKALKIVAANREDKTKLHDFESMTGQTSSGGKGGEDVGDQDVTANIGGASIVLLVKDIKIASDFYKNLGFKYEEIGGPDVAHVHVSRGNITFILHPAARKEDVRPFSSAEGGLYFDAFAYTDAVDLLVDEFRAKGVQIVRGPHYSEHWSEVTIKDADGYRIAFGGGTSTR